MKKVIPFSKKITFKTMIFEVTDIEIKHNLKLNDINELEGNILVDGKYKMTEASIIEEEFHYKLPFVIAIDEKYDTDNIEVSISDFNFEIINEEDLKVNVEITIDNLEEKVRNNIEIPIEIDEIVEKVDYDEPLKELEKELKEEIKENKKENKIKEEKAETKEEKEEKEEFKNISNIFSNLTSGEETFSTYHVYIIRENDTLDSIMDKYKVNREELANYNDLDDIKLGTKLIIPCSND